MAVQAEAGLSDVPHVLSPKALSRLFFFTRRMVNKTVQRGRSEREPEAYSFEYVEGLSDARTKLTGFFTILHSLEMRQDKIHAVVRIVKREIRRWKEPVIGVVARESNRDPFLILISCLLSLRTKDKTTDEAGNRLFGLARTPAAMLKLPIKTIERAIYPVGFYRTKAKSIHQICRRLLETYGGHVPDSVEELVTLPGVGRKTANLVVTVGYGKPGICVDIHVHRISNRLGYIKTRTPDESEQVLRSKLPKRYWITYNDLLVPFGQNLCQPVSPFCSQCKLTAYCDRVGVTKSR